MLYNTHSRWLKPFVDSSKGLVAVDKIKSIKGYKARKDRIAQVWGACHWYTRHKFSITLLTHDFAKKGRKKVLVPRRLEDILITLAHELAHVEFQEHDPAHLWLTARLLKKMAKKAFDLNIMDTQIQIDTKCPQKKKSG